ncbi:hypothetical protein EJ05DRAFT_500762 [Pseudovirgaria hyperparasitica]|uniref:SnoaL-like domain-containing protein n=1 Tax=Pseudovirgaria hyperparasitica TaxID=470096 RepID=A0A6A6W6S7_9PEZI|nr:uncharacterized protein EJ05DRAFT_500762 [Pseudovirgaria hyperparasitica]KAF2758245.1 hypothetical protein EJ05DRAFT_500762 [Pseudovirgaria hyperparasitica]
MSTYQSQYPDVPYDPLYKAFFEEFYQVSDNPSAHEEYAQYFVPDTPLVMGQKKCVGHQDIIALRHVMWSAVEQRRHSPLKVFPFGPNSNEFMLYGTVDYVMKTGESCSKDWAARAVLNKEDGKVRFSFYQVYLDTAPSPK